MTIIAMHIPLRSRIVLSFAFIALFVPFLPTPSANAVSPSWQAYAGGSWSFSENSGELRSPATQSNGNANIAVYPQDLPNDFTLTTNATVRATDHEWNDFSVIFGFQDVRNYYYVSFNERNDKNTNGIFKVQDSVARQLIDMKPKIEAGQSYGIRLVREGTRLDVYRDETWVVGMDIDATIMGSAGMGSRNDEIAFTNFQAQSTSTSTPVIEETVESAIPSVSSIDLRNWKLTLPTGNVEDPDEIEVPTLLTYSNSPYFIQESDGLRFRAPVNGVTTEGSNYPRAELREMTNSGTERAAWSSRSGQHSMFIRQAITAVPETKQHVVAGQIHDSSDDVIVIRLEGRKLFIDIGGNDGPTLDSNYELGRTFTVEFRVENERVSIYYNGAATPAYSMPLSKSSLYFKAGAYTQSNCERESTCSASNYGEVKIYDLEVSHRS